MPLSCAIDQSSKITLLARTAYWRILFVVVVQGAQETLDVDSGSRECPSIRRDVEASQYIVQFPKNSLHCDGHLGGEMNELLIRDILKHED